MMFGTADFVSLTRKSSAILSSSDTANGSFCTAVLYVPLTDCGGPMSARGPLTRADAFPTRTASSATRSASSIVIL